MFGLLVLTSCKKEDNPPDITYYYLPSTLTPYMFNAYTYWVYENDSTSVLDSIIVTSTKQGFFTQPPTHPGTPSYTQIEYYKVNLHSYFTNTDYVDFLFSGLITRNGDESPNFGQPVLLAQYAKGSKTFGAQVWDKIDTLSINGIMFHNIEVMKIIANEQHQGVFTYDTYLYYQDSIGLIKKITDQGDGNFDSWSLKRWHIDL